MVSWLYVYILPKELGIEGSLDKNIYLKDKSGGCRTSLVDLD